MDQKTNNSSLMHEFNSNTQSSQSNTMKYLGLFLVIILLGVGSGFVLTRVTGSGTKDKAVPNYSVSTGKSFGVDDPKAYPDAAEGSLKEGGIEGEGAFHLVRPGGDSQNVYLTSSTVDLSQFIGKKIKVWGKTQTAQYAGWLMDVGKVEVL